MRPLIISAALLAHAAPGLALAAPQLQLDSLFQDHMVLPRQGAIVSGHTAARDVITVSGFGGAWKASADAAGRFSVTLPSLPAGRTDSLAVSSSSGQRVTLGDVITGDVFLCSGQSNMQLTVHRALNADTVIGTSTNPDLRMATVAVDPQPAPLARLAKPLAWQAATPRTVGDWSATCYFFGKDLQRKLKLPIGLVHASLGGSNLTAWLSPAASLPDYARQQELLKLYATDPAKGSIAFGKEVEAWWQASGGPGWPWTSSPAELGTWKAAPDVAKNWENWGVAELSAYDGSIWYGATASLTPAQAAQAATLELGLVDEVDTTWVNGKPVGFTAGAGTARAYPLAAGNLKAGNNSIVLNVLDLWSYGGMYGDQPRQLRLADGSVVPLKDWRWQMPPPANRYPPRAPWDAMAGVSVLYNGMIAPLGRFPFKGALWYQGESNVGSPYQGLLARLFKDWRGQFGNDMAFGVVQLANFGARPTQPVESGWAQLREEQRRAVLADPNAVLATAIDLGDPTDIHPANKQGVGERLARAFGVKLYGQPGSVNGPMVKSTSVQGDGVAVDFDGVDAALVAYGAAGPIGFEVCTDTGCRWTEARVAGTRVVLPAAADAKKIRYCWGDAPTCTLYDSKSGLPALPFEMDVKR
jgi:sialate O-acetylesterase